MNNEKGSVTIAAVIAMIFLGILAAAIGLRVVTDLKGSKLDHDAVQAQFAAEAGAKRAINGFYKQAIDWSWLGQPMQLVKNSNAAVYTVTIESTNGQPFNKSAKPTAGKYTVTAVGKVNDIAKTVQVDITLNSSGGLFSKAIFSGGQLEVLQNYVIEGDIGSNDTIHTIGNGVLTGSSEEYAGIKLPAFYWGEQFDPANYAHGERFFPEPGKKSYKLDKPLYFLNNLSIDQNSVLTVTTPNKTTTIYVSGTATINQNVSIAPGSNILLIVAGSTAIQQNFNKHMNNFGNFVLVSGGAVAIHQNAKIKGSIIGYGSAVIHQNAHIEFSQSAIDEFDLPGSGGSGNAVVVDHWR